MRRAHPEGLPGTEPPVESNPRAKRGGVSYDIFLFEAREDEDLAQAFARASAADAARSSPDPVKERRKRELVRAVVDSFPELDVFPGEALDEPGTGPLKRIDVQLVCDDDGLGLLFTDNVVLVSVPRWHGGPTGGPSAERIRDLLRLLRAKGGFQVYDRQIGPLDLDEESDLERLARGIRFEP